MATDTIQTWGQRSKKTSVIALGLVAILAGVAVAYFLTTQAFENNIAKGGALTVEADGLPIDFTGGGTTCHTPTGAAAPEQCDVLFPTNAADGGDAALTDGFTISNGNPVETSYILYATCPGCTDTTLGDQAQQADQYSNLMVRITETVADPGATNPCTLTQTCPEGEEYYLGRLADLTASNFANLGKISASGSRGYEVRLWLANTDTEQPQTVLSNWTFHVGATLPAPA